VKRIIAPADLRLRPRSGVIAHEPSLSSDLSRKLKTTTRRGVEAGARLCREASRNEPLRATITGKRAGR
jgi:hypothetical protein